MHKFKAGDVVRRVTKGFGGAEIGQRAVVLYQSQPGYARVRWTDATGAHREQTWDVNYMARPQAYDTLAEDLRFTKIVGERSRTYHFPNGATFTVKNVTGLCVRPTNHRLETICGRRVIVPGKFIAIEIEADNWSA